MCVPLLVTCSFETLILLRLFYVPACRWCCWLHAVCRVVCVVLYCCICVIGDSISKNSVMSSRCVFMVVGCLCMSGCTITGFWSSRQERGEKRSEQLSGSVVGRLAARCLGACTVGCGDGLAGLCGLLAQVCVFE